MPEIELRPASPLAHAALTQLVWDTGAALFAYLFTSREVIDAFVTSSWPKAGTTYAHSDATLAWRGDELLGIELGYKGADFYAATAGMRAVAAELLESGQVDVPTLKQIGQRSYRASFLSPHLNSDVYYVATLSVTPQAQGSGVGAMLLADAKRRARDAGCRSLDLDVFSDKPAVAFYERQGLECMAECQSAALLAEGVPMQRRMAIRL